MKRVQPDSTSVEATVTTETRDHRSRQQPETKWPLSRKIQWATLVWIVVVAEIVYIAGQTTLSYAIDVVAVASFFWIRRIREHQT